MTPEPWSAEPAKTGCTCPCRACSATASRRRSSCGGSTPIDVLTQQPLVPGRHRVDDLVDLEAAGHGHWWVGQRLPQGRSVSSKEAPSRSTLLTNTMNGSAIRSRIRTRTRVWA